MHWQKGDILSHPRHGKAVVSHAETRKDGYWAAITYSFPDGVIYNYDLQSFHEAKGWQKIATSDDDDDDDDDDEWWRGVSPIPTSVVVAETKIDLPKDLLSLD